QAICIIGIGFVDRLVQYLLRVPRFNADGLAQLAEAGFYKVVRVKSFDSMLTRTLVGGRNQLLNISTQLSNQIRGLMKTFGLIIP
ncbi:IS110 family transposase, partial [Rhizobium johnstonii]